MIKPEDQLTDDFLSDLLQNLPQESPGEDFVSRVMAGIQPGPAIAPVKKPFFVSVRAWWPYVLAGAFVILFLMTSDLPYSQFIPGKDYLVHTLIPYFVGLFTNVKHLFAGSKSVSIPMVVVFSGAFLLLVDRFLLRRFTTTHIFFF